MLEALTERLMDNMYIYDLKGSTSRPGTNVRVRSVCQNNKKIQIKDGLEKSSFRNTAPSPFLRRVIFSLLSLRAQSDAGHQRQEMKKGGSWFQGHTA